MLNLFFLSGVFGITNLLRSQFNWGRLNWLLRDGVLRFDIFIGLRNLIGNCLEFIVRFPSLGSGFFEFINSPFVKGFILLGVLPRLSWGNLNRDFLNWSLSPLRCSWIVPVNYSRYGWLWLS